MPTRNLPGERETGRIFRHPEESHLAKPFLPEGIWRIYPPILTGSNPPPQEAPTCREVVNLDAAVT
jgi:hypothetical protein